jgi:hypothetical protein
MKKITNLINKQFILNNVNQVSIFSKYTSLDETIINNCIDRGKIIKSPVRLDDKPSVGFKYNNKGILKMRDFGGFFWGDCFDIVALILSKGGNTISVNDKEGFKYILLHIAKTFDIANGIDIDTNNIPQLLSITKATKKIITFNPRQWDANDKRYWITQYDNIFTFDYLLANNVYPVETYWIDSFSQPEPKYYYTRKDPCYAYYLGQDKDNVANIKLYFPNRKDTNNPKFISNNNSFQGINNITGKYDKIVLCKSYKDVLALRQIERLSFLTGTFRILFIAYPSENYLMNDDVFGWLFDLLIEKDIDNIINFLDFDRAGRRTSKYCKDNYGIPYIFITNGELGLPNHKVKDITDFIKKYGKLATIKIFNNVINYDTNRYGTPYYDVADSPF